MLLNCGVGEDSWESLGLQGDLTSPSWRRSVLGVHWKDWCWSWNSNTLATSCEELSHWKRPWCWEGLVAGEEGDNRGWDVWMASPTRWTWVWVDSRGLWWTGRPGVLQFMGSQRVGHDWATEPNWSLSYEKGIYRLGFPVSSVVKNLPANGGDKSLIPGMGTPPGGGTSKPFQYSCLGNPMDRGFWSATVHGFSRVRHDLVIKQQQ